MPVIVTVTTSPAEPTPGPVDHGYIEVSGSEYGPARDEALSLVPEGRRAVAIHVERP